ncbi:hypothetical protein QRO10_24505 [Paracidovorax citrulli]|uniref:Lipid A biosynthesis acyltransferase n=1 Tax=Paracidovorax citrulli (strain AAC00-1) TaxID=397945 RepID=A1TUP7_PARC0|nr:hypothetical protein [Paracidovorax citrulli]ABM34685.1 conserved hypothetical protein [Paracidovorax citrulli AAC00-1]ATG97147.1 hypothetical protein CQB05_24200 [Paracidovorax citrulli]MVT37411.1 hypothetical protein [Paracidovorax citrulli]UMT86213.1 hypothetical protein FRC75_24315 [Paracidovorax citrulli]WIY39320.1 hypothetical protein QRO10_24505 [Paracidovorax citrulli]
MTTRWARAWSRWKRESRDVLEVVLLPGLAAVLPWPVCFRLFRRMARWRWLYRGACEAAFAQASSRGWVRVPADDWLAERRLVTLLDHADHYLFRTRSPAWMRRHVEVDGAWSGAGKAGLLLTFHWGAGMWALCHASAEGMQGNMVLAAPGGRDFIGRWVFGRYVRARMRSVEMALNRPVVFVPGGMEGVRQALGREEQVVVVIDVPEDQVNVTRTTIILGQPVSVPAVLPQMAVDRLLPTTVFYMGVDLQSGRRKLRILPLGTCSDPQELTDRVFGHFDELLRQRPAAWHLWTEAPRFFRARADGGSNPMEEKAVNP